MRIIYISGTRIVTTHGEPVLCSTVMWWNAIATCRYWINHIIYQVYHIYLNAPIRQVFNVKGRVVPQIDRLPCLQRRLGPSPRIVIVDGLDVFVVVHAQGARLTRETVHLEQISRMRLQGVSSGRRLGLVVLDFDCSTVSPWLMGLEFGRWAGWWNIKIKVSPTQFYEHLGLPAPHVVSWVKTYQVFAE